MAGILTMTLLSLASRQIWPQVLSVLQLKPKRVELFHSAEETESKRPAERLKEFFECAALVPGGVGLHPLPHDNFAELMECLASVAEAGELNGANCQLNLTGGNKLMAMAAAEWSRLNEIPCFYLERNLRLFPFQVVGSNLQPQPEIPLDPHLAKLLDPLALLRCQQDAAEIIGPGQRLTLSERGRSYPEDALRRILRDPNLLEQAPLEPLLERNGEEPRQANFGDALELLTALVLLKLGVPSVQRGVRLKSGFGRGHWQEEGELDLVFNWSSKLWIVDCKDRRTVESRVRWLRQLIEEHVALDGPLKVELDNVADELREKEMKPLKEDLLQVSEAGGLLGRALVVRVQPLPKEADEFARSRKLPVIARHNLWAGLQAQLHPHSSG